MCGRYALKLLPAVLELPFVEESEQPELELPWIHYNVCPGTEAPIVDHDGVLRPALWGLIPHWAKSPPRRTLLNARQETAADRGSFRMAWQHQRCVVPTSGFYEWSDRSGARSPYFVPPPGTDSLLWLAGLASRWKSPDGNLRWTYAVLTESSKDSPLQDYHDRMPVALNTEEIKAWLGGTTGPGKRQELAEPYRVSSKMNKAAVNEPSNLDPMKD